VQRAVGEVLAERYELVDWLGGGGMGDVFRAIDRLADDEDDDPYVAIKIPKPELQGDAVVIQALHREASRALRLTHTNIVRIRQLELDRSRSTYFIVMELLEGRPLESILTENPGGQPWEDISGYLQQSCAGLECAHAEGFVHSDIKPSNLFITDRGQIKILDFGIATPLPVVTGEPLTSGTDARNLGAMSPRYASLEMFLNLPAHYSDDVYSLACVAYEWLSGSHPYVTSDEARTPLTAQEALQAGARPARLRGLTRWQNRALAKALALRRADRTQTISEFWESMTAEPDSWPLGRLTATAAGLVLAGALVLGGMQLAQRHRISRTARASVSAPGQQPTPRDQGTAGRQSAASQPPTQQSSGAASSKPER
jgi:serine/threonine protein kinase